MNVSRIWGLGTECYVIGVIGPDKSNSLIRIHFVNFLMFFLNFWIHLFDFKSFYWCARYRCALTFNPSDKNRLTYSFPGDNGWHHNSYIIKCPFLIFQSRPVYMIILSACFDLYFKIFLILKCECRRGVL